MDLDFDDTLMRGLRRYVNLVSSALELPGGHACLQTEHPATAYLPLDGHLPTYPGRDLALLWDERHGWSAAVETHSGEDLIVVADMGVDVLPPPGAVADWMRRLRRGDRSAMRRGSTVALDVPERLARYAAAAWLPIPRSA